MIMYTKSVNSYLGHPVNGPWTYLDPAVLVVALPDAGGLPLHLVLTAEGAGVLGVLRDLHLLHSLPQARAVPGQGLVRLGHLVPKYQVGQKHFFLRKQET